MGGDKSARSFPADFIPYSERLLITGCQGLLGQKLHALLAENNTILGVDLAPTTDLTGAQFHYQVQDLCQREATIKLIDDFKPSFIINTAALTDVDRCEVDKELCWRINVLAVETLIRAAKKVKAHLIQISSDYVFDGTQPPYSETDAPRPLGYYGKSKLAAENALRGAGLAHTIVRTQILYGVAPQVRPNFATFVVERLNAAGDLNVVNDQRGCPTLADDLARGIAFLMQLRKSGIYHLSGSESVSRFEFARELARQFGHDPQRVKPLRTAQLHQRAQRPADSTFDLHKIEKELRFLPGDIRAGVQEFYRQWQQQKPSCSESERS